MAVITAGMLFYKHFILNEKGSLFLLLIKIIAGILMRNGEVKVKGRLAKAHEINLNPDDYFDSIYGCWRSDPLCGLDVATKRPWESFKNPEKVLWRLNWDMKKNPHRAFGDGYY